MFYILILKFTSEVLRPKLYPFSHLIANLQVFQMGVKWIEKDLMYLLKHFLVLKKSERKRKRTLSQS